MPSTIGMVMYSYPEPTDTRSDIARLYSRLMLPLLAMVGVAVVTVHWSAGGVHRKVDLAGIGGDWLKS